MPFRRKYRPRRRKRRNAPRRRRKIGRPSRGLTQSVYLFKTRAVSTLQLNAAIVPGFELSENGLCRRWSWKLSDLPGYGKYQSLFKSYKLNYAKVEIYASSNTAGTANEQMISYMVPNLIGKDDTGITETDFLETQAMRRGLLIVNSRKPLTMYMRLKQLSMRYGSTGIADQTDYASVKPRYVDVHEENCEHYGYLTRFQLINNTALPNIFLKIITTVGISCRGVV